VEHIVSSALPAEVLGLYDRKSKQLYVKNSGQALGIDRWTIAHEYTHAMQDQHFNLTRLEPDQSHWKLLNSDEALAVHSLVEGDAVDVQDAYLIRYYSPAERQALFQQQQSQTSPPVPRTIQEQFDFPYTAGPSYVAYLLQAGGYQLVNRHFRQPPTSTFAIMYPGSQIHVTRFRFRHVLGEFRRWTTVDDDVNGAFGYQQLVELYVSPGLAGELARLWRGDRYLLIHRGRRYGMYLLSQYPGRSEAARAAGIMAAALARRFGGVLRRQGEAWAGRHGIYAALRLQGSRVILSYAHSPGIALALAASSAR
jgi:hypothetical protein